ncbi:MAG: hypothetical protein GKR97_19725 [Rhizobiaceae bacterium]|nr:hypothetical protein [Rhizobiaceae bacterium]
MKHEKTAQTEDSIDAAMKVMQAHIDGINARDGTAIAATLHFPHFRLTDGQLKTWNTSDSYLSDFRSRAGQDWSHSAWGHLNVIHQDDNKVHLDVEVVRYGEDGSLLIAFPSLWVVAKIDGIWAAQLRSSFAPDADIIAERTFK